jgi:hypothetical protein
MTMKGKIRLFTKPSILMIEKLYDFGNATIGVNIALPQ